MFAAEVSVANLCAAPHQEPNPGGQPHADAEVARSAPITQPAPI